MNETEALRYAASYLRTVSSQDTQPGHLLHAARVLDAVADDDGEEEPWWPTRKRLPDPNADTGYLAFKDLP